MTRKQTVQPHIRLNGQPDHRITDQTLACGTRDRRLETGSLITLKPETTGNPMGGQ